MRQAVKGRVEEEERMYSEGAPGDDSDEEAVDPEFVRECLDANEYGDGTLFAHMFRGRFAYVQSSDEWLEWGGHSWKLDVNSRNVKRACEQVALLYLQEQIRVEAERMTLGPDDKTVAKKLDKRISFIAGRAKKLRSSAGRRNCLEFAATCEEPIDVMGHHIDAKPTLLAVANGVVDLTTGDIRDGRPQDWLLRSSPVEYDPDADTSVVERFMRDVYGDDKDALEKIAFLQRLYGLALFGDVRENIMPVCWGEGRNGKDTWFDIMKAAMGNLAGDIQPEMLLDRGKFTQSSSGPSPDIMALKGMRVAIGSETDKDAKFSLARVKWLTGSKHLVGRNPHDKHNTTFPVSHVLFLMTNNKPSAGNDYAFWKRCYLISHPYSFVDDPKAPNEKQRDKHMAKQLEGSVQGVLKWMVDGALSYLAGGLRPPACVMMDTKDYQAEGDEFVEFLGARCLVSAELRGKFPALDVPEVAEHVFENRKPEEMITLFKAIYPAYDEWYRDNKGDKPWAKKTLGAHLKKYFTYAKQGDARYEGIAVRFG